MTQIRPKDIYKAKDMGDGAIVLSVYSPAEDVDGKPIHTLNRMYRVSLESAQKRVSDAQEVLKMHEEILEIVEAAAKKNAAKVRQAEKAKEKSDDEKEKG